MSTAQSPRREKPPFDYGFGVNAPEGPTLDQSIGVVRALMGRLTEDVRWHVDRGYEPNTNSLVEIACLDKLARMADAILPCEQQVKETIKRARRKVSAGEAAADAYARRPAA